MNRTAIGIPDQIDSRSRMNRNVESKPTIRRQRATWTMLYFLTFRQHFSLRLTFSSSVSSSPLFPSPPRFGSIISKFRFRVNGDQLNFFRFVYSPFRNNLNANGSNRWRNFRLNGFSLPLLRNVRIANDYNRTDFPRGGNLFFHT